VSSEAARRPDVVRMSEFLVSELEALGASVETRDVGMQKMHDGTTLKLPPVVLATYGNDPAKKTVLVYGHYDVQPVSHF
jgi:Cys-Gly metallodipeptidase DUG1